MDTLTHNTVDVVFDELADVDVIGLTDGHQGLVDFGVELGSNILAIESHLRCSFGAKVCGEFFDVRDARVLYLPARDFLNGPYRHAAALSDARPLTLRVLELI
jgi:hypothetical protein